ncbi:hypothetical protein C6N75_11760 [Streptomyces solincola]|uniref:Uncharacterized protein n=1 Tax=Streptomyces solincola TaxID=2100817 RepID=A0A2S9PX90_9ACTN|nr:hypothetical protein [Streptomyces solincola]PRH79038.1 hypothetical protein C6N75_11760 [Streptomyces solincola]
MYLLRVPTQDDGERALRIFDTLMSKAEDGTHNVLLSVTAVLGGNAVQEFQFKQQGSTFHADPEQALEFVHLLAIAVTGAHAGGMVMRSVSADGAEENVYGWAIRAGCGDPRPLNRAEVFNAYCTDAEGEPIAPEPGVGYKDAPVIHI